MQKRNKFDTAQIFNALVCWTLTCYVQFCAFSLLGLSATFHQAISLSIVITGTTLFWSHLLIGGSVSRK